MKKRLLNRYLKSVEKTFVYTFTSAVTMVILFTLVFLPIAMVVLGIETDSFLLILGGPVLLLLEASFFNMESHK